MAGEWGRRRIPPAVQAPTPLVWPVKLDELDIGPSKVKLKPLGYAVWPDKHEVPFYTRAQSQVLLKKRRLVETFERYDRVTIVEINGGNVHWGLPDIEPPYHLVGYPLDKVIQQLIQYLRGKGLTFETHQQGGVIKFIQYERQDRREKCLPLLRWVSEARRVAVDVLIEGLDI
jgi:hypothetical protein